jgi:hypothetical protein
MPAMSPAPFGLLAERRGFLSKREGKQKMNIQQMAVASTESAEQLIARIRPALGNLSDKQQEILKDALSIAWGEGFGRGLRAMAAISDRHLDALAATLGAGPLPPEARP